jgi:hypothetical protein
MIENYGSLSAFDLASDSSNATSKASEALPPYSTPGNRETIQRNAFLSQTRVCEQRVSIETDPCTVIATKIPFADDQSARSALIFRGNNLATPA